MDELEVLRRAIKREKLARKQAESIMEAKSLELYESNQKLLALNQNLEAEIEKRTQEIAQKEIEFKSLVESATEIIFKIDTSGNFTYINPVTSKISGFSEAELLGNSFTKFIRPDFIPKLSDLYTSQLEGLKETTVTEFPIIAKNGTELWFNQSATLIIENGEPKEFVVLSRNVTEVKQAQEAVALSEEKYRGIIENLELGILEVDNDGRILKAYPQFCKLTGYTEKELIGSSPSTLFLEKQGKKILDEQIQNRLQGKSSVYEIPLRKKNGEVAWVIISGAPFYNLKGEQIGTVGIHLDITHRKSIESQLRESKLKTEELYKVKELFLANMSHEIRTPMNAIIGMAELLEQSKLDKRQVNYVGAIRSSSKNLLVLINDLLDFSKIESGKLTLELIPFQLEELLLKTKTLLMPKADENGVDIQIRLDPNIPERLVSDPTRLSQVLLNLVGNAVKFTTNGRVTVSIKGLTPQNGLNQLLFEVMDEGIGISQEEMQGLFDNFIQANESTARMYGGTGLGLSISKKLVNLLGGKLEVSSTKGKGSNFFFTLFLKNDSSKYMEKKDVYEIHEDFQKARILLVEDNPVNTLIAQTILEKWNCAVIIANNGKEAISILEKESLDLVLMDVRMPVMGGLEATKIIRAKLNSSLPIVALTGNAIKGDNEKCFEAGMNDYISKPFEQLDLNRVLVKWIASKASSPRKDLIDLTNLKKMGDSDFVDRMISIFIEETQKDLERFEQALENKNTHQLMDIAHKIKPSVKYVCHQDIYQDVLKIEQNQMNETDLLKIALTLSLDLKEVLKQLQL